MKVWITCFVLLFGAAEVLQWVQQVSLPLPFFVLGGALLAIASNYDKLTNMPFHLDYEKPETLKEEPTVARSLNVPQAPLQKTVRDSVSDRPNQRPISFTIRKPHQPEG
ncbi:MAG: hypothetical protein KME45_20545 [Stenomitos rutilans HA7619-LM2]|jgi:hypothetical protein|nr:hypothetical protein [Stenomitos rutilans HA7619-LM2]